MEFIPICLCQATPTSSQPAHPPPTCKPLLQEPNPNFDPTPPPSPIIASIPSRSPTLTNPPIQTPI